MWPGIGASTSSSLQRRYLHCYGFFCIYLPLSPQKNRQSPCIDPSPALQKWHLAGLGWSGGRREAEAGVQPFPATPSPAPAWPSSPSSTPPHPITLGNSAAPKKSLRMLALGKSNAELLPRMSHIATFEAANVVATGSTPRACNSLSILEGFSFFFPPLPFLPPGFQADVSV